MRRAADFSPRGLHSVARRHHLLMCLCMAATVAACAYQVHAQTNQTSRQQGRALLGKWRKACERVGKGDPWDEIGDDLEAALAGAGDADNVSMIEGYLAAIRAADKQAPELPASSPEASPEELVALLLKSRLFKPRSNLTPLIRRPLHVDGAPRERRMHWEILANGPEHEFTDPTLRIYKRGRSMVEALIRALTDLTATRCVYIPNSTVQPAVMFRRCDLAMALLETITRCRFYVTERGKWFSHHDEAFREKAAESAGQWWEATKDVPPLEARSELISHVKYEQAKPMIGLLRTEGETARAIDHLRAFLIRPGGDLRMDVARELADLGDLSGLDQAVKRANVKQSISHTEAAFLIKYGGRREYKLLRRMLEHDLPANQEGKNAVSKAILKGVAQQKDRPMAIPLLAVALYPDDTVGIPTGLSSKVKLPSAATRADLAAALIQQLTERNFRYDPSAAKELRRKGIERVRDWWEREGRGLYGVDNAGIRRGGGIR